MAKHGALTCGKAGQDIEHAITAITKDFLEKDDFVVFAIDLHTSHDLYHPETSLSPHNIQGTDGRRLYGSLGNLYGAHAGKENVYWMDKTRYSAFAGTDLEIKLRERNITELHLVGVCTDICILHTAVDAYNKGFQIKVHSGAVASFNEAGHKWVLNHFKHSLGAAILP